MNSRPVDFKGATSTALILTAVDESCSPTQWQVGGDAALAAVG